MTFSTIVKWTGIYGISTQTDVSVEIIQLNDIIDR